MIYKRENPNDYKHKKKLREKENICNLFNLMASANENNNKYHFTVIRLAKLFKF